MGNCYETEIPESQSSAVPTFQKRPESTSFPQQNPFMSTYSTIGIKNSAHTLPATPQLQQEAHAIRESNGHLANVNFVHVVRMPSLVENQAQIERLNDSTRFSQVYLPYIYQSSKFGKASQPINPINMSAHASTLPK